MSPGPGRAAIGRGAATLGHLSVWAGLYVGAAVGAFQILCGARVDALAIIGCAAAANGVYLFDRVKLTDRLLDPADAMARPGRHAMMRDRTGQLRLLAVGLLLAGSVTLGFRDPWLAGLPLIGLGCVVLYALPLGAGRRIKDIPIVKNSVVATTATALAVLVSVVPGFTPMILGTWFVAIWLLAVVGTDAALCDIDDRNADEQHGTLTLPVLIGVRWTWIVSFILGAGVAPLALQRGLDASAITLSVGVPLTTAVLMVFGRRAVRDLIDLRLPALLVAAVALG